MKQFFTTQRVIVILVFLILAFVLYNYSDSKSPSRDGYSSLSNSPVMDSSPIVVPPPSPPVVQSQMPVSTTANAGGYVPKNTGAPSDLLPKPQSGQFSDFNMLNQGNVIMPDMLDASALIGLDTIGQSLRNANYQERSDPIIPKVSVGPWNNSTIEPDLGRVPMEIGYGMR